MADYGKHDSEVRNPGTEPLMLGFCVSRCNDNTECEGVRHQTNAGDCAGIRDRNSEGGDVFTPTARRLLRTLESIATPCSVKTLGE